MGPSSAVFSRILDGRSQSGRSLERSGSILANSLILPLVFTFFVGCTGGASQLRPPDMDFGGAQWEDMTAQIPGSASSLLLFSFDKAARLDLNEVIGVLDLFTSLRPSVEIEDLLGINFEEPGLFGSLGLDPEGAASVFLYDRAMLAIVDLDDSSLMRAVLDGGRSRNPDLSISWREVDGSEVLTADLHDAVDGQARFHLMLTSNQLIVAYDLAMAPVEDEIDDILETIRDAEWGENVTFNRHFSEVLNTYGVQTEVLMFSDLRDLVSRFPNLRATSVGALFGVAPDPRCREVEQGVAEVIPFAIGAIDRYETEDDRGGRVGVEVQHLRLEVGAPHHEAASELLQSVRVDVDSLRNNAVVAGALRLDPATLDAQFRTFDDATSCRGPAFLAGVLGLLAGALESEAGTLLSGTVAAALYDLRVTSNVPFYDTLLFLASEDATDFGEVARQLIETELDLRPTADQEGSLDLVHYRMALLYRLAVYEGLEGIGLTLGRVPLTILEALLAQEQPEGIRFLDVFVDGGRLNELVSTIAEFATDEGGDLGETQLGFLGQAQEAFGDLDMVTLEGEYQDGYVSFAVTERRTLAPVED